MASLKNRAGAVVHRFQSHCERVLKEIDRKRNAVGDYCVDCGTPTEDGYKCDGCMASPSKIGLIGINDMGKVWRF